MLLRLQLFDCNDKLFFIFLADVRHSEFSNIENSEFFYPQKKRSFNVEEEEFCLLRNYAILLSLA